MKLLLKLKVSCVPNVARFSALYVLFVFFVFVLCLVYPMLPVSLCCTCCLFCLSFNRYSRNTSCALNLISTVLSWFRHHPRELLFGCTKMLININRLMDRPFNLRGGYGFLFRSEFFFRTTQELEYSFFLSHQARNFFPEFNIRL
jgi:hypothetical protein